MLRRLVPEMMRAMERDMASPFLQPVSHAFNPVADIHETDKSYIIETEVPGVQRDDISMELVDDSTISIRGKVERKEEGHRLWSGERMIGAFQRTISLPTKVDPEQISASLKDGILKVELLKTEEPEHRRIPIKVSSSETE